MKRSVKIAIALFLALVPGLCQTVSAQEPPQPPTGEPIELKGGLLQPRARAPRLNMTRTTASTPAGYYNNGIVYIEAGENISYISATVTRLEDNVQWSKTAAGNSISIQTSTDQGTYYLELTLSNGAYYYGEFTLE